MRARELGIRLGYLSPGPLNAITDVSGVKVGHSTIIAGDGPLVVGTGPVRTGVTVILAHEGDVWTEAVFAGCHRLNGNGELTGLEWVRESGELTCPIGLTNTHSVGVARDALVSYEIRSRGPDETFWGLPVVGETWDGRLNDVNGLHVKPSHVFEAIDRASSGPVPEGSVGGGTGMVCHGFKGGIGTSSRVLSEADGGYTVGVLVQANYGRRQRLRVDGVPVGEEIPDAEIPSPHTAAELGGSIIVLVATDAPMLPHQLTRVAQRPALAVARMGGTGEHTSGDLFLAFSTANRVRTFDATGELPLTAHVEMLSDRSISAVFDATVEATEEAIVNSLLAAETMTGRDGITAFRLPPERLLDVMRHYRRLGEYGDVVSAGPGRDERFERRGLGR